MKYGVLYSSVGCLADNRSGPYDTVEEAAEYVRDQYEMALDAMNDANHDEDNPCVWCRARFALAQLRES